MANPSFTTNGNVRFGAPISGIIRATSNLALNRTSNAKALPTTTGDVGFTSGVRMAELSLTLYVIRGSAQARTLVAAFESQTPMPYDFYDGNEHHTGNGVIATLNITSQTNEAIEYACSIAASDGDSA